MIPALSDAAGNDSELSGLLSRVREITGVSEAMVLTSSGRPIAFVTDQLGQLLPQGPPVSVLNQLRVSGSYAAAENVVPNALSTDPSGLILRVIVPLGNSLSLASTMATSDVRWLQLMKPVPESIVSNAEEVREGYRDYQELALSRKGLRQLFVVTLTLALLLAVFAAMAVAFVFIASLGANPYWPWPQAPKPLAWVILGSCLSHPKTTKSDNSLAHLMT